METSYKEKYEQALAKAKEQYNYPCMRSCMGILEEIFPELAESEDEKVRKEIEQLIRCMNVCDTRRERWLSWLEKQGTPAELSEEEQNRFAKGVLTSCALSFIDYLDAHKYEGKMCVSNGECEDIENAFHNAMWDRLHRYYCKYIEKQGEQKPQRMISAEAKEAMYDKPADTVEPKFKVGDKIYLKPEYRMPNDDTPIANTVKEIRRIDDKHYRFDGSYIFIEDQDKYELVEQKPEENKGNIGGISANWSEEDEENFCSVYLDVKSARQNTVNSLSGELKEQEQKRMDEVISWLKSLKGRVQPKQEWNEEDEKRIKKVMHILSLDGRISNEELKSIHDWLKSLRPHNRWKPSDEQMEALYKASKNEYLKADQYDVLSELWNNLKKLKEE